MPKRLVVACDGTWDRPGEKVGGKPCPTNVWKLHVATAEKDANGVRQVKCYHTGVGVGRWDHLRGGAFGVGLSRNVRDTYEFVVDNYEPGDDLFLIGFSRGAYTARSLGGLIRNCGILRHAERGRIKQAYALYRNRRKKPASEEAKAFRRAYAVEMETPIRCIAVWDTVGALGIPLSDVPVFELVNRRWQFHDVTLSRTVASAFQALAVDELRSPFKPAVWQRETGTVGQQLEQVWFSGVHRDVGGGYPEATLADIPLLCLADHAQSCGLAFTPGVFARTVPDGTAHSYEKEIPVYPDAMGPLHESRRGWYKLLRKYHRPIGSGDEESLASSAITRVNAGGYHPPELERYMAVNPVPYDVDAAVRRMIGL